MAVWSGWCKYTQTLKNGPILFLLSNWYLEISVFNINPFYVANSKRSFNVKPNLGHSTFSDFYSWPCCLLFNVYRSEFPLLLVYLWSLYLSKALLANVQEWDGLLSTNQYRLHRGLNRMNNPSGPKGQRGPKYTSVNGKKGQSGWRSSKGPLEEKKVQLNARANMHLLM